MAKGSESVQQSTTPILTPEQKSLLGISLPNLEKFAAKGPVLPNESFVAPFTANQVAGQEQVLGATGTQKDIVGSAGGASKFLTSGDVLNAETNPGLASYMRAATAPISEQLTQTTLPAIRGEAQTAGQFGGSRQGIAEGLASQGASRAIGATTADIANRGYGAGLNALTQGLSLAPGTAGAQAIPGLATSGVGDVQQQLQQAMLGEKSQRFNYENLFPLLVGQQYAQIASGLPGAGTTTTANVPKQNPWMQGAGLGLTALGMFL